MSTILRKILKRYTSAQDGLHDLQYQFELHIRKKDKLKNSTNHLLITILH